MASKEDTRLPSSASSHRLPTVSASQALHQLKTRGPKSLSTGLKQLDEVLRLPRSSLAESIIGGGLARGQITEVYGPVGVGKTTFAAQICVNTLRDGHTPVWIDGGHPLVQSRFDKIDPSSKHFPLKSAQSSSAPSAPAPSLKHIRTPTLVHLLALIFHSSPEFPPTNTSVVVIDGLSTLFDDAYPRNIGSRGSRNKDGAAKWASNRRYTVMNDLMSKLGRLAALHNLAVVITCQTVTRMRPGAGAVLLPALTSNDWDNGIATKLVLFRDWLPPQNQQYDGDAERLRGVRFIGVEKTSGRTAEQDGVGTVIPFMIENTGIKEVDLASAEVSLQHLTSPIRPPKRPFAEVDDSEADEDSDELYGWEEEHALAAEGLVIDESAINAGADEAPAVE